MAFDGLVCKSIVTELLPLVGAKIEKVFEPNKNNIVLGLYLDKKNYLLNISIDPQNYRINLSTHKIKNPQTALNFCMVLRKYILNSRIKNIYTIGLERVVFIELEHFNSSPTSKNYKIIVELMGKHSNIILVDDNDTIIDSLRHIKNIEENSRNILPHIKYEIPKTNKLDFFECTSFEKFKNQINTISDIYTTFNGISKSTINLAIAYDSNNNSLEKLYNYLTIILNSIGTYNLNFLQIEKDYLLIPDKNDNPFCLNFFIDDFYYSKESKEYFKVYRDNILKNILTLLKKYRKRLYNIDNRLNDCKNMNKYKLYGELLTANLYKFKEKNLEFVEVENYYDNNNLIKIPLDKKYSINTNARMYFKKYTKLKNAVEIVGKQKDDTVKEINYLESIVFELENSSTNFDIENIYEEISENIHSKSPKNKSTKKSKKSNLTKNKFVAFNPRKYVIDGYTILVGRNNKENDILTLKYANKTDLWFHTKDIHGSHVILKVNSNTEIPNSILVECAKLAVQNSKAKNSSNVPVDYCLVKNVRKPPGAKPGMVVYVHNKTLYV